ncbi:hypothetical protein M8A51_18285 [Schlegelella sp. S2-27]|uniref:Uncharacterized protein n=1 Tax=Caldimonas mangrovi TaxID=2944811 RepID=A0ABT0YRW2_9BURK|nr:hypothetical protein [Caldimonas mangrovi]MCM5681480.1 hypothetical protein [Caldimonas mangrovi]
MNAEPEMVSTICELRGSLAALDVALMSLVPALSDDALHRWEHRFVNAVEMARVSMLNGSVPDAVIEAFDQNTQRWQRLLMGGGAAHRRERRPDGLLADQRGPV